MLKRYLVCLTSNREQCEIDTAEIAKRNNAIDYEISGEIGPAPFYQVAYRGFIIKEEESKMKYDFISDFVHGVVKEYDWTMPKYTKEEYDNYNEYECECYDIGHDYEYEIAEIAVDRMVRASRLSRQEAQNCGDEISEAVWNEIVRYIIANMDKEETK